MPEYLKTFIGLAFMGFIFYGLSKCGGNTHAGREYDADQYIDYNKYDDYKPDKNHLMIMYYEETETTIPRKDDSFLYIIKATIVDSLPVKQSK